jgi:hypothetical protein
VECGETSILAGAWAKSVPRGTNSRATASLDRMNPIIGGKASHNTREPL